MGTSTIELTAHEIHEILHRGAFERLRMNAFDMLKAYRAGELRDPGAIADLLAYARLLSPDDPLALGASRPRP